MSKTILIVQNKWTEVEFELMKHKDTDIFTLKLIEENFETLEEHQLLVNNMLLSKYVGYFEKQIEEWKQDLGAIYDVVQTLIEVQKSWSFLENLFIGSQEVQRELPTESKQFEVIHTDML
jgi:dynein heavy chain